MHWVRDGNYLVAATRLLVLLLLGTTLSSCGARLLDVEHQSKGGIIFRETFSATLQRDKKRLAFIRSGNARSDGLQPITSTSTTAQKYVDGWARKLLAVSVAPERFLQIVVSRCPSLTDRMNIAGVGHFCADTLLGLGSESELVFLVAHEIAHAVLRHGVADKDEAKRDGQAATGAYFFLGPNGMTAAQALATDARSGFRRKDEREADLLGVDLMVLVGANPLGAYSYFELLTRSKVEKVSAFQSEQEGRRMDRLRSGSMGLDSARPDGGAAGAFLLMNMIDRGIVSGVDDRDHDESSKRMRQVAEYINIFYKGMTSRPLGTLPWRATDGRLRADFRW